jgi:hypothetical protein
LSLVGRVAGREDTRHKGYTIDTIGITATFITEPSLTADPPSQRRSSLMLGLTQPRLSRLRLLVLAGLILVHPGTSPALERRGPEHHTVDYAAADAPSRPTSTEKPLPQPTAEMREAILAGALTGRIEELRVPLEWNELTPDVSDSRIDDPIAYWKKTSGDGEGREILAALANILQMRPAHLPLGKDLENNIIYVWPYLAEANLEKLTPAEEVDLLRLVSPAEADAMRKAKKWTWWRLAIGADGTWHSFKKRD